MVRRIIHRLLFAILACASGWYGGCSASWGQEKVLPYREIRAPKGYVCSVVFSRDGKLLAGGVGSIVVVWNADDGKEVVRMQWPKQQRHQVAFAHDRKTLISTGLMSTGWTDETIRIFDLKTGKQVDEFPQPRPGSHFQTFSADARRMAVNGNKSRGAGVDVFDLATRKIVLELDVPDWCRACAFSEDGKLIATNTDAGGVRVWDAATGKLQKELRAGGKVPTLGTCNVARFSPDAKFLATSFDESLSIWNVQTGKMVYTFATKGRPESAFFSPDGLSLLYVTAYGQAAVLHHLIAEKDVCTFLPPAGHAYSPCFSPDFKRLAVLAHSSVGGTTSGGDEDAQVSLFLFDVPPKAFDPAAARFDDAPLDKLWNDLNSDNDLRLQMVLKVLRAAPGPTVELVANKVQPVAKERLKQVEKLISDLDDESFTKRDEAMKEVQSLAHQFAPLLRAKLSQAPAGEVRNRLTLTLNEMDKEKLPAALVTQVRAVSLLKDIATRDAQDLLERLAHGADGARLTVEARTALKRLKSKAIKEKN